MNVVHVDIPDAAIIVATRNASKLTELRALLAPINRELVDLEAAGIRYEAEEEGIEDADTFEENALAKARYYHARSGRGAVIADDSGLCVAALGGAPGVRSRRYAGVTGSEAEVSAANSRQLLRALEGELDRRAEFVCAVAYVDSTRSHVAVGRTSGRIMQAPHGTGGFGYDPLFWSDDLGTTFGKAASVDKARVSHRARAARALVAALVTPHTHLRSDDSGAEALTQPDQSRTLHDVRGVA